MDVQPRGGFQQGRPLIRRFYTTNIGVSVPLGVLASTNYHPTMATKVQNLIASAEASKDAGLERVLIGLAIRGCGPVLSRKLAERFRTMERLLVFASAYQQLGGMPFKQRWHVAESYAWECLPGA